MQAGRLVLARLHRALAVPIAVFVPPLFWVVDGIRRASFGTLGRDQGIFQYVAWAIGRGDIDYRDVRDVNGPLTHLIHVVFLALGGAAEHRFRCIDLAVTSLSFAFVGACLPGLGAPRRGPNGAHPRQPESRRVSPSWIDRGAWAAAAWVVLSSQYLLYSWWDSAQRESFLDWFVLPSCALQLAAQGRAAGRGGRAAMAVSGALSVAPWFGKPTFALFTFAQLGAVLADADLGALRRRTLAAFALGGAVGAAVPLAFLLGWGDAAAYVRIQLHDVPAMYRFIWPRSAADVFATPFYATHAAFALVGTITLLAFVVSNELPPRALAVVAIPLCGVGSVVLQSKGFPYHFHPVTAGVYLQWLLLVAWAGERARVASRRWAPVRLAPIVAGGTLGLVAALAVQESPAIRDPWLLWAAGRSSKALSGRDYFEHFDRSDFFPYEMRQAAEYVRRHTTSADRIQLYGMDPYMLFLAGRLSATPYIYAYDLNVDAALSGGTGGEPTTEEASRIRDIRARHEADLLVRVAAAPPAAFVFFDGSPLLSKASAWEDFEEHCPETAAWVRDRFSETAVFGHDHVWLRHDLSARVRPPD
jgi:hypothetical protein